MHLVNSQMSRYSYFPPNCHLSQYFALLNFRYHMLFLSMLEFVWKVSLFFSVFSLLICELFIPSVVNIFNDCVFIVFTAWPLVPLVLGSGSCLEAGQADFLHLTGGVCRTEALISLSSLRFSKWAATSAVYSCLGAWLSHAFVIEHAMKHFSVHSPLLSVVMGTVVCRLYLGGRRHGTILTCLIDYLFLWR